MKNAVLVALICLNAALAVALAAEALAPPANAQVIGGGTSYLMVTGRVGSNFEAVYVLDLASRRLVGLRYDRNRRPSPGMVVIGPVGGRPLKRDFGRDRE